MSCFDPVQQGFQFTILDTARFDTVSKLHSSGTLCSTTCKEQLMTQHGTQLFRKTSLKHGTTQRDMEHLCDDDDHHHHHDHDDDHDDNDDDYYGGNDVRRRPSTVVYGLRGASTIFEGRPGSSNTLKIRRPHRVLDPGLVCY